VTGCEGEGTIGTFDVIPGRWYHVAVVVQRNSQRLYVNGEEISSSEHHPIAFAYRAFLGVSANQDTPVGSYFRGTIDDVHIYNRALSESEVHTLYESESYCEYTWEGTVPLRRHAQSACVRSRP